jgi:hypothetical protein
MNNLRMSHQFTRLRTLVARLLSFFNSRPLVALPSNTREFYDACKELAFWSASDAGLDGPIEAFDGSLLDRAADGMCTIRMTLRDSLDNRSPAEAAATLLRSLGSLRVLLLIDIDGSRFVNMAPNVNLGVRELGKRFTNRSGRTG